MVFGWSGPCCGGISSVSADRQLLSRLSSLALAAVRGALWVPFPCLPLSPGPRGTPHGRRVPRPTAVTGPRVST